MMRLNCNGAFRGLITMVGQLILFSVMTIGVFSCAKRDYITYYQKVNEADSLNRIADQPNKSLRKYNKLFKKFEPKNTWRVKEFEQYVNLSNNYNKGLTKAEAQKLIFLLSPERKENNVFAPYFELLNKYGIDTAKLSSEINLIQSSRDQEVIDSFRIAIKRDQEAFEEDEYLRYKISSQNFKLIKWTIENNRFPSIERIGLYDAEGIGFGINTLLLNVSVTNPYRFLYLKENLLKYVRSGEFSPFDYAMFIDSIFMEEDSENTFYGTWGTEHLEKEELEEINKNRKSIGLPSIQHTKRITSDFLNSKK